MSASLKMAAAWSSEMSANIYKDAGRHILDDSTSHIDRRQNFKSQKDFRIISI
jgi:hypothetical protein